MRTQLIIVVFAVASLVAENSSAQVAQSVSGEPTISITVKTPQSTVTVGSDVEVEVEMKNISAGDILYSAAGLFGGGSSTSFRWDVRDGAGKAIPMTQYGIKANHLEPPQERGVPPSVRTGSAFAETLSPGKTVVQKLALSKEYDLSKPGKYTIQALRFDGKLDVKSNIITLIVTP
jgi:hypothetical protein